MIGSAFTTSKHTIEDGAHKGMDGVKYVSGEIGDLGGRAYQEGKKDCRIGADFLHGCKTGMEHAASNAEDKFEDGIAKIHEMTADPYPNGDRRHSKAEEEKDLVDKVNGE
jgi:hypothetical protein